MVELIDQSEILPDVLHLQFAVRQLRGQGLQRDFDAPRPVETSVDHAHAAPAEFREHFVTDEDQIADLEYSVRFPGASAGHGHVVLPLLHTRPPAGRDRVVRIPDADFGRYKNASVRLDQKPCAADALVFAGLAFVFRVAGRAFYKHDFFSVS